MHWTKGRTRLWLGHYRYHLLIFGITLLILGNLIGSFHTEWLVWLTFTIWVTTIMVPITGIRYHLNNLCEKCISEAPDDPDAEVTTHKRELRLFHSPQIRAVTFALLLAWGVFAFRLSQRPHLAWWLVLADCLGLALLAYGGFIMLTHRRLEPWCPYCRSGGGGSSEVPEDTTGGPGSNKLQPHLREWGQRSTSLAGLGESRARQQHARIKMRRRLALTPA